MTARIGEAALSVAFFLLGGLLGTLVIAWNSTDIPGLSRLATPWGFWFSLALSASFLLIGGGGVIRISVFVSDEHRAPERVRQPRPTRNRLAPRSGDPT